jgi:hypothetical protein
MNAINRAREHLADLEAKLAKLTRSRARTPGKKGARTRALNKLSRQIATARGLLTKARNKIVRAAKKDLTTKAAAKRKRSEAAKKGWASRCARKAAPAAASGLALPFLTSGGVVDAWPSAKSERSKVGSYWNAIDAFLSSGSRALLDRFAGDSIYDEISGKRLRFVTDATIIIAHSDEYDFGATLYRERRNGRFTE